MGSFNFLVRKPRIRGIPEICYLSAPILGNFGWPSLLDPGFQLWSSAGRVAAHFWRVWKAMVACCHDKWEDQRIFRVHFLFKTTRFPFYCFFLKRPLGFIAKQLEKDSQYTQINSGHIREGGHHHFLLFQKRRWFFLAHIGLSLHATPPPRELGWDTHRCVGVKRDKMAAASVIKTVSLFCVHWYICKRGASF